jgi:hypothetical protein
MCRCYWRLDADYNYEFITSPPSSSTHSRPRTLQLWWPTRATQVNASTAPRMKPGAEGTDQGNVQGAWSFLCAARPATVTARSVQRPTLSWRRSVPATAPPPRPPRRVPLRSIPRLKPGAEGTDQGTVQGAWSFPCAAAQRQPSPAAFNVQPSHGAAACQPLPPPPLDPLDACHSDRSLD